jgi:hypothetical protein
MIVLKQQSNGLEMKKSSSIRQFVRIESIMVSSIVKVRI